MTGSGRIDELRRRVQQDPASIAFAQLAEEHRRAGDLEEAVSVSRSGLDQHPAYLSARVTLGRSLLALDRLDEAEAEFARVLEAAPDNLVALRAQAEIHQRTRTGGAAARRDPDADGGARPPDPTVGPSGTSPGADAVPRTPAASDVAGEDRIALSWEDRGVTGPAGEPAGHALLTRLETWLAALESRRRTGI